MKFDNKVRSIFTSERKFNDFSGAVVERYRKQRKIHDILRDNNDCLFFKDLNMTENQKRPRESHALCWFHRYKFMKCFIYL